MYRNIDFSYGSIIFIYGIILLCILYFNYKGSSNIKVNWNIFNLSDDDFDERQFLFVENNLKSKDKNKNEHYKQKKFNKIVGIDFGTINSGISYSLDYDVNNIITNRKGPTEIILFKEDQRSIIHSNSAPATMMNYNEKELSRIIYIKTIKSVINSLNETINNNLCFVYPNSITLNIANILKSYFTLLKNDILSELKEEDEKQILFIIAAPSNWNEFQKQLILKSFKDSGISNIKMIYESEAASLCISDDKYVENKYKYKNNIFLLIDAGGSKTSLSVNKIEDKNGGIKPILNFVNNDFGSIFIIEEIINIFINIFGENPINYIKYNNPGAWIIFLKDVKVAIESTHNLKGMESFELTNIFNTEIIKYYEYDHIEYRIKFNKYDIIIPSDLIGNIILKSYNKFKEYLDNIMNILKEKNIKLNSILITGGFAQNQIFKDELDKYGENRNIPVQYMSSFQYVISKGCVIYGINPEKILPRKSQITLGIYNFINNKMDILIKKGDEINNEITIVKYIKPQLENQQTIQILIYLTDKDIKEYNDLKEYLLGRVVLKNIKNINNIILNIKYDTHLNFNAKDYDTGNKIETVFEFNLFKKTSNLPKKIFDF